MAVVESLVANLTAKTAAFERGMRRSKKQLTGLGKTAALVGNVVKKSFMIMGAAAVGAGLALAFPIKNAMKSIDAVGKLSDRLQISTETLTGLGHAARITGNSMEDISKAR